MVLKLCRVHAITVSFSPGFVLSNILNFSSNIQKYDYTVFLFLLSVYIWWAFTGNCNNIKAIPILLYFPCYFIGNKFSVQSISFKEQFRFMIWPFLEIVFLDFLGCCLFSIPLFLCYILRYFMGHQTPARIYADSNQVFLWQCCI